MTVSDHDTAGNLIASSPFVSVIIPVYNVSRYLPQCIESVISQTYQNIEIVIIDDGSTDGSGKICDQYAERDPRIRVIHSMNRGLASARNLGLENARGTFISFIDSDDWMEPHAIEALLRAAVETDADVVKAGHCSEHVGIIHHFGMGADGFHTYHGQEIMSAFSEGVFGHVAWNKLYRAECFDGIRYPDGQNYEDVSTTWKILKKLAESGAAATALPDELFHFRIRKSSISHTWSFKNVTDSWLAYHTLYEALPDYRENFLASCFIPIGQMWISYCGFSKEDRDKAETTIREMHAFSKKHFRRIMRGKNAGRIKLCCLISQSDSPAAMRIWYYGGRLREAVKNKKNQMFR